MQFDLPRTIRRTMPRLRRTRRVLVLRDIPPNLTMAGDLARIYMRVVRAWAAASAERILPAYRAALARAAAVEREPRVVLDDRGLAAVIEDFTQEVDRLLLNLTADLREWVVKYERWHRRRWTASLTPSGVDLSTLLTVDDVQVTLETVLQQNVSLVRSVSDVIRRQIEQIVFDGFRRRLPARTIARELANATNLGRKRALRIVSHQTVQLSAQLDTDRMKQAGITTWEWVHSGKVHFRPEHKARDGNRYTWDKPPPEMPGELPNCGCRKKAVLDSAD